MLRKLFFGSLVILAVACNKEQAITPAESPYTEGPLETANESGLQAIQRSLPEGGLKASASGPATSSQGSRMNRAVAEGATAALISFEPNAGAIWKDPATNATHLLALQLPGTVGNQVKWASLGTGWEGSEMMTMDKDNFYIVWENSVFMVPKKEKNVWYPLIVNSGEAIKGIVGTKYGGFLGRGNKMYYFSPSGEITFLYTKPGIVENIRFMAGYDRPDGSSAVYFLTSKNNYLHYFNYSQQGINWSFSPFDYIAPNNWISMTANPMTGLVYLNHIRSRHEVNSVDPSMGHSDYFSIQPFSPGAPLVTNNGYVWIMGSTLYKLRTLGSLKGKAEYAEYGWEGVLLSCADPELVF